MALRVAITGNELVEMNQKLRTLIKELEDAFERKDEAELQRDTLKQMIDRFKD